MLTSLATNHGDRRFTSRSRDFRHIIVGSLKFEDVRDFAGDAAAVARLIDRDGLIAPEHNVFAFA